MFSILRVMSAVRKSLRLQTNPSISSFTLGDNAASPSSSTTLTAPPSTPRASDPNDLNESTVVVAPVKKKAKRPPAHVRRRDEKLAAAVSGSLQLNEQSSSSSSRESLVHKNKSVPVTQTPKRNHSTFTASIHKSSTPSKKNVIFPLLLLPQPPKFDQRRLLVVLDLNGTLFHRAERKPEEDTSIINGENEAKSDLDSNLSPITARPSASFTVNRRKVYLRPFLQEFLTYLLSYHHVAVWTSAQAMNAVPLVHRACAPLFGNKAVCEALGPDKIATASQFISKNPPVAETGNQLAFIWTREHCDVLRDGKDGDVIKDLSHIWKSTNVSSPYGAQNTVLVDDSMAKFRKQPHNGICISTYKYSKASTDRDLLTLIDYLEAYRTGKVHDVREYIKSNPFK